MKGLLQGILVLGLAYGAWLLWNESQKVSSDAERGCHNCKEVVKEMEIHDYGSLQQPISLEYGSAGQAVGQTIAPYGNPESAFVSGFGQNYQGRAVGL